MIVREKSSANISVLFTMMFFFPQNKLYVSYSGQPVGWDNDIEFLREPGLYSIYMWLRVLAE